jgi:hypothetical protein
MRSFPLAFVSLTLLSLAACEHKVTTVTLSPAGQQITLLSGIPTGCAQIGDVFGRFTAKDPEQAALGAKIQLRNKAAEMGANTLVIQTNNLSRKNEFNFAANSMQQGDYENVLGGLALRCPGASAPPPPPAPPSQSL